MKQKYDKSDFFVGKIANNTLKNPEKQENHLYHLHCRDSTEANKC